MKSEFEFWLSDIKTSIVKKCIILVYKRPYHTRAITAKHMLVLFSNCCIIIFHYSYFVVNNFDNTKNGTNSQEVRNT